MLLRKSGLGRDDRRSALASAGGDLDLAAISKTLVNPYPDEELQAYDRTGKRRGHANVARGSPKSPSHASTISSDESESQESDQGSDELLEDDAEADAVSYTHLTLPTSDLV